MNEKKILSDNVINFFGKKEEYRSLSNFWTYKTGNEAKKWVGKKVFY